MDCWLLSWHSFYWCRLKTEMVKADVKSYLAGLLWTLETYQKGHCADYGYNYGQRAGPAVFEVRGHLFCLYLARKADI